MSNLASSSSAEQSRCPSRGAAPSPSSATSVAWKLGPPSPAVTWRCRMVRHVASMARLLFASISAGLSASCTSWFESSESRRPATSLQPEQRSRRASPAYSRLNSCLTLPRSWSGRFASSSLRRRANSRCEGSASASTSSSALEALPLPASSLFRSNFLMVSLMISLAFRTSGSWSFSGSSAMRACNRSLRVLESMSFSSSGGGEAMSLSM
mmetsp:Transcript_36032/g.102932  ORF Transcript_36032/g.102932 Transcript_36032/m.102932 type:complete len:211 (-) Transcript_36032:831-1463(-)